MIQNRVMQHRDSGLLYRAPVNFAMQMIVADVIQRGVGSSIAHLYRSMLTKFPKERRRIIRDTGRRGWQRRKKSDGQSFLRGPNSAVPTRTCVEPSSIAASRSCDIPMDNF